MMSPRRAAFQSQARNRSPVAKASRSSLSSRSIHALALIVIGCWPMLAPAQSLGRLFMTPAERAALDASARPAPGSPRSGTSATATSAAIAEPAGAAVRVDGLMKRSAGRSVVWLNGAPTELAVSNTGSAHTSPRLDGDRVVIEQRGGATLRLRPGESDTTTVNGQ